MSKPGDERPKEKGAPRFPWHDLGKWVGYWLVRFWSGIKWLGRRLREIPPHRRNTYLAMVGMVALLLVGGTIIGLIVGHPGWGILFVILVTAIWLVIVYFKGNSILPLLAGAKPANEEEHRGLVDIVKELVQAAELPMPSFWIAESPELNAFTCGRDPQHAAIVVYAGALDIWKGEEIKGILAHEVAHIKNRDTLLDTFMRAIMNGMEWSFRLFRKPFEWSARVCLEMTEDDSDNWLSVAITILGVCIVWFIRVLDFLFGALLLPATHLVQMAASRQQEYFADMTGAEIAGSSKGLLSALVKLQVIEEPLPAMGLQKGRGFRGLLDRLQSTHPPTDGRIRRLGGQIISDTSPERSGLLFERALLITKKDKHNDRIAERLMLWQEALDIGLPPEQAVIAHCCSAECYLMARREELAFSASDAALAKDAAENVGYFLKRRNRKQFFPIMGNAYLRAARAISKSQGKDAGISFLEERVNRLGYIPGEQMPRIHLELAALYQDLNKREQAVKAFEQAGAAEVLVSADEKALRMRMPRGEAVVPPIAMNKGEEMMMRGVSKPPRSVAEHMHVQGGDMEYKVVPVDVSVLEQEGVDAVAKRVETLINKEAAQGWEFISLENIEIVVTNPGDKGCFGIGATPETSRVTRFDMAVFQK